MPPMYDYRCPRCGQVQEAIRCIANRNDGPFCYDHPYGYGTPRMELVVSPVRGVVKDPAVPRKQK